MEYSNYSIEDFASDDRFVSWVNGDCSEEEDEFWRLVILSNPGLEEKIESARALVKNVSRAEDSLDPVDSGKVFNIWADINSSIETPPSNSQEIGSKRRTSSVLAVALVFFALTLGSVYLFVMRTATPDEVWYTSGKDADEFVEHVNLDSPLVKLQMPDGSFILLEQNSKVKYKRSYASDSIRAVFLMGEAFFDVVRDPKKPFVVFTRDVATKVLGTSFCIRANKDEEEVIVAVKTGKVSVYSVDNPKEASNHPKGVVLLPNQQVVYMRSEKLFEKKLVDVPKLIVAPQAIETFSFTNTPIDTVFGKLQQAYGVEIVFDRETMKNCSITAPFGSEPLFDKIKLICETIGASYEVIDAKIVVTSAGCETENINN